MPKTWTVLTAAAMLSGAALLFASAGAAEVRFGKNVRIGGHDVSNQTFNRKRRGVYHLYERRPPNEGCTWRSDGRGGRVKVCHLRRIR